jgi:SAM-dependent methyltransferase
MEPVGEQDSPASTRGGAGPFDWGIGCYEGTAEQEQLLPAAQAVIERAAVGPGERVVDLGCGTGNAATAAAARGSEVIGVDPAERLLEVARARVAKEQTRVSFVSGHAASIPVEDASVDAIVSVFALIFAPDPAAAAAEMSRVVAPTGRIVFSAWVPSGTMFEMTSAAEGAVREALGAPPAEGFAWHDEEAVSGLLGPHGFDVRLETRQLAFTAPSAQEFFEVEASNHPVAVAGLGVLDALGHGHAVREKLLSILQDGNEDRQRFRITAPYVIATIHRQG